MRDRSGQKNAGLRGPACKPLREGLVQPPQHTNWRFRCLINFAHRLKLRVAACGRIVEISVFRLPTGS
jgi:hypothetical protein